MSRLGRTAVLLVVWPAVVVAPTAGAPAAPAVGCGWPALGAGPARSFAAACDSAVAATTVDGLDRAWHHRTGVVVTATPVLDASSAYVGDWSGRFWALDLETGRERWTFRAPRSRFVYAGQIVASAALARAGGRDVVVVAAGPRVYALDIGDGAVVWKRRLGQRGDPLEIESSPVVADGLVVVGSDTLNRPGARAGLWALDLATGAVVWHFDPDADPAGAGCGDVWSSPAVDLASRTVYAGVANCPRREGFGPAAEALVALDLGTGALRWTFQPHGFNRADLDFAGAPNLLAGGLVGSGNKDGTYYALDARTGELRWQTELADPNPSSGGVGGLIAPAATSAGLVVQPAAAGRAPYLSAIDAATGTVVWTNGDAAPSYGPPAVSGDIVFAGDSDGRLRALDLATGRELWHDDLPAAIAGGVAVTGDWVVTVTGFRLPNSGVRHPDAGVVAYRLPG